MTVSGDAARVRAALEERIAPGARARLKVRTKAGIPFLEAVLPSPFRALFTTRHAGGSRGAFATLNLDPRSGDDPATVSLNRGRVADLVGELEAAEKKHQAYRLVSPAQAHGMRVVGAAEYARHGEGDACDGLTLHPFLDRGLAALLLFADCVPLVLSGEVDMAIVHAGWRGIVGGIVRQAGSAMTGPPGMAVIGPSIGPCCFVVGEEVAAVFSARFGADVVVGSEGVPSTGSVSCEGEERRATSGAGPRVDLWAAVTKALGELGVGQDQVVNPRLCTACNVDLFYSYRVEGPVTGRHGCVAWASPVRGVL